MSFANVCYVVLNDLNQIDTVWFDYTNHGASTQTEVNKYVAANGMSYQTFEFQDHYVSDDEKQLVQALSDLENQKQLLTTQLGQVRSGNMVPGGISIPTIPNHSNR